MSKLDVFIMQEQLVGDLAKINILVESLNGIKESIVFERDELQECLGDSSVNPTLESVFSGLGHSIKDLTALHSLLVEQLARADKYIKSLDADTKQGY